MNNTLRKIVAAALAATVSISAGAMSVSAAWNQNASGQWSWTENGKKATGWKLINGKWYYMDQNGTMQTGWKFINGKWYHLQSSGAMTTGWVKDKGEWYHLSSSGAMTTGWMWDGQKWYHLGSSGAMTTGWMWDGQKWYHLESSGAMSTGWVKDNGEWYHMNSSGAMETGFFTVGDKTYFASSSGDMQSGVVEINGDIYYFGDENDGAMKTGRVKIDGITYNFSETGECVSTLKPTADVAFNTTPGGSVKPVEPTVPEKPSGGGSGSGSSDGETSEPEEPSTLEKLTKVMQDALSYRYDDFTYTNLPVISGTQISYTCDPQDVVDGEDEEDHTKATADLARYLGALYRVGVEQDAVFSADDAITYDGKAYNWKAESARLGSNWEDSDGNTLVAAITEDLASLASTGSADLGLQYQGEEISIHIQLKSKDAVTVGSEAASLTYNPSMSSYVTRDESAEITNGQSISQLETAEMGEGGQFVVYYTVPKTGIVAFDKLTLNSNGKTTEWSVDSGSGESTWLGSDSSNYYFKWGHTFAKKDSSGVWNTVDNLKFDETITFTNKGVIVATLTYTIDLSNVTVEDPNPVQIEDSAVSLEYDPSMSGYVTQDESAEITNGDSLDQEKVETMGRGGEFVVYYTVSKEDVPAFDKLTLKTADGKKIEWEVNSDTGESTWLGNDGENYYFKWGHTFAKKNVETQEWELVDNLNFAETIEFSKKGVVVATLNYTIDLSDVTINPSED